MITVPIGVVEFTTTDLFKQARRQLLRNPERQHHDQEVSHEDLSGLLLEELLAAAKTAEDTSFQKDVEQVIDARKGVFKAIRSANSTSEVLLAYLGVEMNSAWVYQKSQHGFYQPYEVSEIRLDYRGVFTLHGQGPSKFTTNDLDSSGGRGTNNQLTIGYARRRPEAVLAEHSLYKETPELRNAYRENVKHMLEVLHLGNRIDVQNQIFVKDHYGNLQHIELKKKVQCVSDVNASEFIETLDDELDYLPLVSVTVPVFDLWAGKSSIAYVADIVQHVWRKDAVDRLVLPEAQKRVLELAVGPDADTFGGDFVDDKTPGNILLCKGEPGIGKTLTAEAYAEATESALYPVDMNILATNGNVGGELRLILSRARRWGAFVLLDEADVVVAKRGNDVQKNAIVAEVLKAVERYEKPIFMTTNRPDDIDEAVISRCLMILHYEVPAGEASVEAWLALSSSYNVALSREMAERFVEEVGSIAPREIGQILRLSARMAARDSKTLDFEYLIESAAMRGINPQHKQAKEGTA